MTGARNNGIACAGAGASNGALAAGRMAGRGGGLEWPWANGCTQPQSEHTRVARCPCRQARAAAACPSWTGHPTCHHTTPHTLLLPWPLQLAAGRVWDGTPHTHAHRDTNCTLRHACTLRTGHASSSSECCGAPVVKAGLAAAVHVALAVQLLAAAARRRVADPLVHHRRGLAHRHANAHAVAPACVAACSRTCAGEGGEGSTARQGQGRATTCTCTCAAWFSTVLGVKLPMLVQLWHGTQPHLYY